MYWISENWKNIVVASSLLLFSIVSVYLLGDTIIEVYQYYRTMFGPVFWIFLLLAAVLLSSVGQLLTGCYEGVPTGEGLRLVEVAGPSIGFLGTVLALMNGLGNLVLSGENLVEAINGIIHTIAVSLSTTAAGLMMSLLAWAIRAFLIPYIINKRHPQSHEQPVVKQQSASQVRPVVAGEGEPYV